ncbi:hypothetical protein [Anaerobutyricum soehngenii]
MCVALCGRFRLNEGGVAGGLRQLNEGKIYRKLRRAGCWNDFSNTL